jgi:DNA polymerase
VDRALEAEAKALLRAARAQLEELVEEEYAWTRHGGGDPTAREAAPSPAREEVSAAHSATEPAAPPQASRPTLPLAGERRTLEQVRAHLGDCTRCPLHSGRKKLVFGDGNPNAELMFVGEGPGEQEDLSGLPFVGRAGELLTQMIERGLEIPRASVYIANVVKCRPPNNRTPLPNEVAACREFLDGQIDAIRPRVIVALGKPATSLLLGRDVSITRVRGSWHDYRGYPVMPTFHPAYLLRSYTPENRRLVWQDLKAALERSRATP